MAKNVRNDNLWSVRVTAAADRTGGAVVTEESWVGLVPVDTLTGKDYEMIVRRGLEIEVPFVASTVRGSLLYITSGNALTLTATSNTLVGRVTAIQGQKGCPTGFMRVALGVS